MLVAICVCGFKKNAPAMSVKLRLCLWVQKNAPAKVFVALCVCGFKKNVPATMLVAFRVGGFKKYTREGVCCSLCLWVQKNVPEMLLVALCVCRFKKMYPRTELNGCV